MFEQKQNLATRSHALGHTVKMNVMYKQVNKLDKPVIISKIATVGGVMVSGWLKCEIFV